MDEILRAMKLIPKNFGAELGHLEADLLLCRLCRMLASQDQLPAVNAIIEEWHTVRKPYGYFSIHSNNTEWGE